MIEEVARNLTALNANLTRPDVAIEYSSPTPDSAYLTLDCKVQAQGDKKRGGSDPGKSTRGMLSYLDRLVERLLKTSAPANVSTITIRVTFGWNSGTGTCDSSSVKFMLFAEPSETITLML